MQDQSCGRVSKAVEAALFCLLCSLVFWILYQSKSYPFVFDDYSNILENRSIRYLDHPRIFLENIQSRLRPLTSLSYAFDYWRSNLSLSGFRKTNIFLHLLNGILVYLLFRPWSRWGYWGAALFLVHPIAADVTVYLTGRSSLLCFSFVILAVLASRYRTLAGWSFYLLFSLLAFFSREMAAVIPLLVILGQRLEKKQFSEAYGYLWPWSIGAITLVALKWNFVIHAWAGVFRIHDSVEIKSFADFLRLQISLWPKILTLFFTPSRQALDHAIALPVSWFSFSCWIGIGAVAGTLTATWQACLGRHRDLWVGLAWIFFSLLPTNSLFPTLDPFGERHFYFALPGLALFFLALLKRIGSWSRWLAHFCALLVILSSLWWFQVRVSKWKSAVSIWTDSVQSSPQKFRAVFNLGQSLLLEESKAKEALQLYVHFVRAENLEPVPFESMQLFFQSVQFLINTMGLEDESQRLQKDLPEGFWRNYFWLKTHQAERYRKDWVRLWDETYLQYQNMLLPVKDPHLFRNLLQLLMVDLWLAEGKTELALRSFSNIWESFQEAHFPYWTWGERIGDLYQTLGQEERALDYYQKTAYLFKVYKHFPDTLLWKLYFIYQRRGDLVRASDAIGELIRVRSDEASLRKTYSELLKKMGRSNAPMQASEAVFYQKFAVPFDSEREVVQP